VGSLWPQVLEGTPIISKLFIISNVTHILQVLQFPADAPYCVQATIEWGSMSDFKKATEDKAAMDAIMGDVSNFSNTSPKLMTGEVVGSK
jgi:hypothetical protein